MFGRKRSEYTFDNIKSLEAIELTYPVDKPAVPPVDQATSQGADKSQSVQTEDPEAAQPQPSASLTKRPDPKSFFPKGNVDAVMDAASGPVRRDPPLKLDETAEVPPTQRPLPKPRDARTSGRAKTRLLAGQGDASVEDVLGKQSVQTGASQATLNAVGWLVVVSGPGRGNSIAIRSGVSQIGRGDDQVVQLDFGDSSISRNNHASIAFDEESRGFFLGHGGKSNIVRANDAPVLTTMALNHGDLIRIGETTLQLVAFCGSHFTWSDPVEGAGAAPVAGDQVEAVRGEERVDEV